MHFHLHIHALLHYARLLRRGSSMRLLGMMLLMLAVSLLQQVSARSVSALLPAGGHHARTIDFFRHGLTVHGGGETGPGAKSLSRTVDRTNPVPPPGALHTNGKTSVFFRLLPRLVMIPRMNRTPKPASVYRGYARAPGTTSLS